MDAAAAPAPAAPAPPAPAGARPLRVLHLLPDLAIGGGQTIVLHHARRFDRDRFAVEVAYLLEDDSMAAEFAAAGVRTVPLGHRNTPAGLLRTMARLLPMVRAADVLHVHSGPDAKVGQVAALLARRPVVRHLHSEWVHFGARWPEGAGPLRRTRGHAMAAARDGIERRVVRHYVAESESVHRLFTPLVSAPMAVLDQSIAVERFDLEPGVRAEVRAELGLPADARVVTCLARMVEGKGHVDLVRAVSGVAGRHPDLHVTMIGGGPLRPAVEAAVAEAGLEGRFHLLGDRFDVPRLLAAADVLGFASETEGFGLAVLEAMAARLPVAAFRLTAFEEFVIGGTTGHLVPPGDLAALGEAISSLLDDPEKAREMGRRGRAVVEERFPSDAVARSFAPVHEAAARARRRPTRDGGGGGG